jgi:hypothetical protein
MSRQRDDARPVAARALHVTESNTDGCFRLRRLQRVLRCDQPDTIPISFLEGIARKTLRWPNSTPFSLPHSTLPGFDWDGSGGRPHTLSRSRPPTYLINQLTEALLNSVMVRTILFAFEEISNGWDVLVSIALLLKVRGYEQIGLARGRQIWTA